MSITLNKKIKKRKIDLIIPKGLKHNLIIPNYSNLGYNLIILKNNDNDILIPSILMRVVKIYEFDNPLIQHIDSIIDECYRDCQNKYFHAFWCICEYNINFTNITNNEMINFEIPVKSLGSYELKRKLTLAKKRGFKFNQINNLKTKIYSDLKNINIHYYLKHQIPMGKRLFFRRIAKNRDYIETYCNDVRNPFHYACQRWYSYNNPDILT